MREGTDPPMGHSCRVGPTEGLNADFNALNATQLALPPFSLFLPFKVLCIIQLAFVFLIT